MKPEYNRQLQELEDLNDEVNNMFLSGESWKTCLDYEQRYVSTKVPLVLAKEYYGASSLEEAMNNISEYWIDRFLENT